MSGMKKKNPEKKISRKEREQKRREWLQKLSSERLGCICYLCGDSVDVLLLGHTSGAEPTRSYTPLIYLANVVHRHGNLITTLLHSLVSAFAEQIQ